MGTVEPFARAQKEILGDEHAYPMVAYGTMKSSGAWKMYAKASDVPYEISDAISKQIARYEKALKHADDDEEKAEITIDKYIDARYLDIYKRSEQYLSTIVSWSIAPSAYLLYSGNIEEEIGLIRIKDNLCCLMDGHWAEDNRFLKNDLLKVVVVDLISQVFNEIGIPRLTVNELLAACPPDDVVWNVYAKSCTMGINQVEQAGTSSRVAKYAPKIIAELCAFVAAIRPGFKSMYKTFEKRQRFSYNIESFDKLITTPFMPDSFVLYQEHVMRVMNYAGFPMAECYAAIKNIAKKRVEKVLKLKDTFIDGFSAVLREQEHMDDKTARDTSLIVWKIIEDNSGYSFNASHAYCVALDSLYCAYLKSHYPVQFYGVYMRLMTESGKKEKVNAAQAEAQSYYKIKFPPYRFGQDNSIISIDVENNAIYMALKAIKGFNKSAGVTLTEAGRRQYDYFCDLICDIRPKPYSITENVSKMLVKIDYFTMFGNQRELNTIINLCVDFDYGERRSLKRSKIPDEWLEIVEKYSTNIGKNGNVLKTYTIKDCRAILRELEKMVRAANLEELDLKVRLQNQNEVLGYISTVTHIEADRRLLVVLDVNPLYNKETGIAWGYAISTQSIGSGKHGRMTIRAEDYNQVPVQKNAIIYADNVYKNKKGYWYLNKYEIRG